MDLREYDIDDLWREIGVIFQDFVRYEMSGRDNIAVGRIAAAGDDWRLIRKAARKSLAHDGDRRGCRRDTTSCSAAASTAASTSRAASGRRSRSPVRTCVTRSC